MLLLAGVFGVIVLLKHHIKGISSSAWVNMTSSSILMYIKLIQSLTPQHEKHPHIMMLAPPCFTVFIVYCSLNWVLGVGSVGAVWQTVCSQIWTFFHQFIKCYFIYLGQSVCSLANCNLFSTCHFFADSIRVLIVTVLTGNIRSSLINLELIIGLVFAILAVLPSIWMVVFHFLPRLSGFGCHFNTFEIIYTEQRVIYCTNLHVFPFPINVFLKVSQRFFWTMFGMTHFTQIFKGLHSFVLI